MQLIDKKIILASKSPRRSQLLKEAGIAFEVKTIEVDETFPDDLPKEEVAVYLARKKAMAMAAQIGDDEIVLAADSIVLLGDTIYGKPESKEHAVEILSSLAGNVHRVITGVCLLSKEKERTFSSVSKVFFRHLSREEILFYIDQYQPFDKAGAYAIQEWIGLCKIERIEGTYANIMGLPVDQVYYELKKF